MTRAAGAFNIRPVYHMNEDQIQETRTRARLAQDAWTAARKAAASERDAKHSNHSRRSSSSWRNMWIALTIAGAVLLFLKLRIFQ
jgi:hypothetical protein